MMVIPKNMNELVNTAKDLSIKIASTVGKLCNDYVAKAEKNEKPASPETEQTHSEDNHK